MHLCELNKHIYIYINLSFTHILKQRIIALNFALALFFKCKKTVKHGYYCNYLTIFTTYSLGFYIPIIKLALGFWDDLSLMRMEALWIDPPLRFMSTIFGFKENDSSFQNFSGQSQMNWPACKSEPAFPSSHITIKPEDTLWLPLGVYTWGWEVIWGPCHFHWLYIKRPQRRLGFRRSLHYNFSITNPSYHFVLSEGFIHK